MSRVFHVGSKGPVRPKKSAELRSCSLGQMLQPDVVVIENVAAFIDSTIWRRVTALLRTKGDKINWMVLDAVDFGVPQLRRRSFTFASRIGMPCLMSVIDRPIRTVREAWFQLSSEPNGENHHTAPTPSRLALARMQMIPTGGDKRNVLRRAPSLAPRSWRGVARQATDVWGRLNWDAPSNTLRTCLQNPSKGRYIHPDQHRTISLREAARLHSIPDAWRFYGLATQIARQIGNSVPPSLGRSVARSVKRLFQ